MTEIPTAARGPRHPWVIVAGLIVVVAGLAAAVGFRFAASQRLDDAVAGLARAPVGCDTVLDFDTGGTYILFIETTGRIDQVRGNCGAAGEFEWDGGADDTPTAVLTLTDPDGKEVELSRDDDVSYDAGGSVGTSVQSVEIDEGGDHTLRVESTESGFAIAVGHNPNDGIAALRFGALAAGLVGLIVGGVLTALGLRRGSATSDSEVPWNVPPAGGNDWPSSPPGFPAPPATTGATAAVGPPTAPPLRIPTSPLPIPPGATGSSHWGPPPPSAT